MCIHNTTPAQSGLLLASMQNLRISSGVVKLNREFDVSSSGATTMLLDFDGDGSVRQTGNGRYTMSPVIAVVSVQ